MDAFLKENGNFVNYGLEHLVCFSSCIIGIILVLYIGKKQWTRDQNRVYLTIICALGAFLQLFKAGYKYQAGYMDITNDLPLHLCNLMTLLMPFIIWFDLRKLWGITFFWIMAGCAQSIFTPTLTESMPHYEALRYWVVHAVIILGALHGLVVYGYKLSIYDSLRSILGLNLLAAILYPINVALQSNYMYLNGKPPGKTFYDLLGTWPGYIVSLEIIVVLLFIFMVLPFYTHKIPFWLKSKSS
jgi:hypothetical integral membrane protein (TIGR02206 family)